MIRPLCLIKRRLNNPCPRSDNILPRQPHCITRTCFMKYGSVSLSGLFCPVKQCQWIKTNKVGEEEKFMFRFKPGCRETLSYFLCDFYVCRIKVADFTGTEIIIKTKSAVYFVICVTLNFILCPFVFRAGDPLTEVSFSSVLWLMKLLVLSCRPSLLPSCFLVASFHYDLPPPLPPLNSPAQQTIFYWLFLTGQCFTL